MTKEQFNTAKYLRDSIQELQNQKSQVEKTRARENDDEFNMLRSLAHSGLCQSIEQLEKAFNAL